MVVIYYRIYLNINLIVRSELVFLEFLSGIFLSAYYYHFKRTVWQAPRKFVSWMQADIFHGNTIYRLSFLRLLVKINSEISIHYALLLNENIKKLQCSGRIFFAVK